MKLIYSLTAFLFSSSTFPVPAFSKEKFDTFVREEKEVLTKNFLDPDSVNYRKPKVRQATADDGEKLLSLCGEVNAKNAMGTYAGYKRRIQI